MENGHVPLLFRLWIFSEPSHTHLWRGRACATDRVAQSLGAYSGAAFGVFVGRARRGLYNPGANRACAERGLDGIGPSGTRLWEALGRS